MVPEVAATEASSVEKEAKPEAAKHEEKVVAAGKAAQLLVKEEEDIASSIHNNDTKILTLLNETGSNYSFKGMMRKLEIHQQSLARALHRLEEMGLVQKAEAGYRLSTVGESAVSRMHPGSLPRREYLQLLQTYIPIASVRPVEVVRSLVGKWFKNLRWLGMISGGTGYTLQWASDDGSFQVNLRIISDYIVIETNASSERDKVHAMVGSYSIYEHIARLLQSRVGAYAVGQLTMN